MCFLFNLLTMLLLWAICLDPRYPAYDLNTRQSPIVGLALLKQEALLKKDLT